MKRFVLVALCVCCAVAMRVSATDGMKVTSSSGEQCFVLEQVKHVCFTDAEMVVTTVDEAVFSFDNVDGWQITFGEVDPSALDKVDAQPVDMVLYDTNGVALRHGRSVAALGLPELPGGVYIVKVGDSTIKIRR